MAELRFRRKNSRELESMWNGGDRAALREMLRREELADNQHASKQERREWNEEEE